MSEVDQQRFTTPEFRAFWVFLDKQKTGREWRGQPRPDIWQVAFAAPKDHPFWEEFDAKVELAAENAFESEYNDGEEWRSPKKDGDEDEKYDWLDGHYYFVAEEAERKPHVWILNEDGGENYKPTDWREEIYSGIQAVMTARCGGYSKGSLGVKVFLHNVLKVADGERIGPSAPSGEADFEGFVRGSGSKGSGKKKVRRKKKTAGKRDPLA